MKKIIFLLVFIFIASYAFAAGPANLYKVAQAKVELYNGSEWVTVFEGTSTFVDIAAVDAGEKAGEFMAGVYVPDGTYTQGRVTPSTTFYIRGNDGAGRYTTGQDSTGCTYSTTAADEATCTFTVSSVPADTQVFSPAITVTNGVPSYKMRVSFDVSQAVEYQAALDRLFPAAPTVTVTQVANQ